MKDPLKAAKKWSRLYRPFLLHDVLSARTADLPRGEAEALYRRVVAGNASPADAEMFRAQMLTEMAAMSADDGLVMQVHAGAVRNHNPLLLERFGRNVGADIPTRTDYVSALKPLLDRFGNDSQLTIILFTLDETTYSRELAPIAGHYPAVKLGPPWWFHDSLNGMRRFRDLGKGGAVVMEGRDIGTVVFPDADLKFYIDAVLKYQVDDPKLVHDAKAFASEQAAMLMREAWVIGELKEKGPNVQYNTVAIPRAKRWGGMASSQPCTASRRWRRLSSNCRRRSARLVAGNGCVAPVRRDTKGGWYFQLFERRSHVPSRDGAPDETFAT